MKRALLSTALAIACIASLSAQDRPDFAGTWKGVGTFTTWTITVEGARMTVTRTVAGNSESTFYMLDGSPSANPLADAPGENVFVSTWEGDVLVTTITGPLLTLIERRSIEGDGTMKVQNTLTMMRGKPVPPGGPGPAPQVLQRIK